MDCVDLINPEAQLPVPPNADPACAALLIAEWELLKLEINAAACECQQNPDPHQVALCQAKLVDQAWERMNEIMAAYYACAASGS